MYSTNQKQADKRIVVDVMQGNWSDVTALSLLQNLLSSSVFDGAVFVLDEAMPGDWPIVPLSQSAIRLATGSLNVRGGEDCLCCGFRSSLGDTLRQVFLDSLAKRRPIPSWVVILADTENNEVFRQTLRHAPFLSQRYVLRHEWRVDTPSQGLLGAG